MTTMAITEGFGPRNIRAQIEKTNIKGRHLIFIDDLSREELADLFAANGVARPVDL